jgi:hypothetical protein
MRPGSLLAEMDVKNGLEAVPTGNQAAVATTADRRKTSANRSIGTLLKRHDRYTIRASR